jgi:predicted Zn-dependent protease
VQMAPKDGRALVVFTLAQENSPEAAAEAAIKSLQLKLLESQRTKVNGLPAVATVTERVSKNQQGQQQHIRVLSYFIEYGGRIYVFHGVSSNADFTSFSRTFESTMVSFNRLTDSSKLNKQPERIRIREVKQGGTLAEAFGRLGVAKDKMSDLALLNNMELTDRVSAGKLLKVVSE